MKKKKPKRKDVADRNFPAGKEIWTRSNNQRDAEMLREQRQQRQQRWQQHRRRILAEHLQLPLDSWLDPLRVEMEVLIDWFRVYDSSFTNDWTSICQ